MTGLFWVTAILYASASVAFWLNLFGHNKSALRVGLCILGASLCSHLGMIGLLCIHKQNPLKDIHGALGLSAWLLGIGYFITTVRSRFRVIGAIIAPLAFTLFLIAQLTPPGSLLAPRLEQVSHVLGRLHIGLIALGVTVFGLAAAVSILYLFQETALKSRRSGGYYRWFPPLNSLDDAARRLILVGFPLFTLAVISGLIWSVRLPVKEPVRLEYILAAVTWTIFGILILARCRIGLRGRVAAILTIMGFLVTIVILLLYTSRRLFGV